MRRSGLGRLVVCYCLMSIFLLQTITEVFFMSSNNTPSPLLTFVAIVTMVFLPGGSIYAMRMVIDAAARERSFDHDPLAELMPQPHTSEIVQNGSAEYHAVVNGASVTTIDVARAVATHAVCTVSDHNTGVLIDIRPDQASVICTVPTSTASSDSTATSWQLRPGTKLVLVIDPDAWSPSQL